MNTPFDFEKPQAGKGVVYIRPVAVSDLPDEVQAQADGREEIYAVHTPDGMRLALVQNRKLAFELARDNDFSPVGVH